MDDDRRVKLIEAEYLRHMAMAKADQARRAEHEEVAQALRWALDRLEGDRHDNR